MDKKRYAYACTMNSYYESHQKHELDYELFQTVYANDTNNKPLGGLWLSQIYQINLRGKKVYTTSWLDYIGDSRDNKPMPGLYGFIINLKKDAKILIIDTIEELKKAYQQFPNKETNKQYYLDYKAIAEKYDAILVNPYVDDSFTKWRVTSMVIFNLEAVDTYQPFDIFYDLFYDGNYEIYNNYIKEIEEPRKIKCKIKKLKGMI